MEYHEEFEDGIFRSRGFLNNGLKEGVWYYFYDTGEIKNEVEYVDGVEHGTFKLLAKDGTLLISANKLDGKLADDWLEYYDDGQLKEFGLYINGEYSPIDFWDNDGNQLMKNGTGKKIEEYGTGALLDIYEHYFEKSKFIKEIKISGYKSLGFRPKED